MADLPWDDLASRRRRARSALATLGGSQRTRSLSTISTASRRRPGSRSLEGRSSSRCGSCSTPTNPPDRDHAPEFIPAGSGLGASCLLGGESCSSGARTERRSGRRLGDLPEAGAWRTAGDRSCCRSGSGSGNAMISGCGVYAARRCGRGRDVTGGRSSIRAVGSAAVAERGRRTSKCLAGG